MFRIAVLALVAGCGVDSIDPGKHTVVSCAVGTPDGTVEMCESACAGDSVDLDPFDACAGFNPVGATAFQGRRTGRCSRETIRDYGGFVGCCAFDRYGEPGGVLRFFECTDQLPTF